MHRRQFLGIPFAAAFAASATRAASRRASGHPVHGESYPRPGAGVPPVRLFLCGDVMTGRGIDQILPQPSAPAIPESYIKSAMGYVQIAERVNGPIPRPVNFDYIWGDVLEALDEAAPHVRIVNLETAVTTSDDYWRGKGINYRMHPDNVACLTAAGIDCCVLANNHVLDWGYAGLAETLESLRAAGIKTSGAGHDLGEAAAPAVLDIDGQRRVIVFSFGSRSSGVPSAWSAAQQRSGIWLQDERATAGVADIATRVASVKRPGDVVVVSIHWGGNWGYEIPGEQRRFARALIDHAGVDLIHGHSSHHPKGIEVYRGKLILYGWGDFLNDYEGIGRYQSYRNDLALMYLPKLDPQDGRLLELQMQPMHIRRFRLHRASRRDARWLAGVLDREGARLGTGIDVVDGSLRLRPRT